MKGSGYPDDIHQYDSDPRSPFYDDGGKEDWIDNRRAELLDDPSELPVDLELIGESIFDLYECKGYTKDMLHIWVVGYIEELADKQAAIDWENRE